ncbi:ATPase family AAA domain-containing protein 2-like isoform X3 [Odontomachus brunneus]|uniref:ATPase family AAA domain-containing protein 2-like isoform X3 n=1 Tax=Odontomachus brunneus TaxID=486640 RepID=UPI0013F25AE8|nr:ATPase family AAA domain-containing protein 2-like isoform X3 [Odontomachus brunneus]
MSNTKDFSCVGGLEKHIRIVKEMVLFPLMYGEVYAKFNLRPPRGLLFYGPPGKVKVFINNEILLEHTFSSSGTGKTLIASALATECSNSERKVSFISRKGSDCLSKWVGESEKKLEKIFSLAQQSKPCIIFFDEVDGLAPVRSSRQDFVHVSVVSTLLALMDGLNNNSEIIVIGATNRIDAIDPALRRPGRFDKELYFPLPCYSARKEILSVHIKSWKQKPAQKFLAYLASKTLGFCGSDLHALCAEAVMCSIRRNYPQIYTSKSKYHINERHLKVEKEDFLKARQNIVPASHRVVVAPIKSLSTKIQPLLQEDLTNILSRLQVLCPVGMLTSDNITGKATSKSNGCPRILLCGNDDSHTRHLGPALLHTLEHLPCHVLDVTSLFEETGKAAEEAMIQKIKTARRTLPALLYVPGILTWWDLVDETARVVFTSLMRDLDRSVHMLVLMTAHCQHADLPSEIKGMYDDNRGEIYEVRAPSPQKRRSFFKQLFLNGGSDDLSNCSSQDLIQILSPKKFKGENNKKLKGLVRATDSNGILVSAARNTRKIKAKSNVRNKLGTVRSSHSTSSRSRTNIKREYNACGEGPPSKRQKVMSGGTSASNEKLFSSQIEDLVETIVRSTDEWQSHLLESLFSSLEFTMENNGDLCTTVNEYVARHEELKRAKMCAVQDED